MKREIGIIGAGVGGLHLGLYLRKHGVDATIITDRTPEDYVGAKLFNTVAHHFTTVEREDHLGVNHWPDPEQLLLLSRPLSLTFPSRCISVAISPSKAVRSIIASISRF